MSNNEVIINQKDHPDIYEWLSKYVFNYKIHKKELYTLTSDVKINTYTNVYLKEYMTQIKYPFGYVGGDFGCGDCYNLTSLIGSPETVGMNFSCESCKDLTSFIGFPKYIEGHINLFNKEFSNDPSKKERYKLYLAMWLELFESVNNKEREIYIKSYKDRVDSFFAEPIIPIEILKEYGF